MPIDYSKYPTNWKNEIRPAILSRAANKCEFCGIENYTVLNSILKVQFNGFLSYKTAELFKKAIEKQESIKLSIVVLTIAHIDQNLQNNDYSNLAALCQKCHLKHDAKQHIISRRAKKFTNQLTLNL